MTRIQSVSYTHLDVYKRQLRRRVVLVVVDKKRRMDTSQMIESFKAMLLHFD